MKEKLKKSAAIEWACAFCWLLCWALNDSFIYLIFAIVFAVVAIYRTRKYVGS